MVAVLTGKDMPFRVGLYAGDPDLLAVDKVRWAGHPVANCDRRVVGGSRERPTLWTSNTSPCRSS